jgi:hypothetical protein
MHKAKTAGQKVADTGRRRNAAKKATATRRRRAAGVKAAATRKQGAARKKAAATRARKIRIVDTTSNWRLTESAALDSGSARVSM